MHPFSYSCAHSNAITIYPHNHDHHRQHSRNTNTFPEPPAPLPPSVLRSFVHHNAPILPSPEIQIRARSVRVQTRPIQHEGVPCR